MPGCGSVALDTGGVEYWEAFAALRDVRLEDSWVLEIAPRRTGAAFRLEAVLTEGHRDYCRPGPDEQYCYRTGWLHISGAHSAELTLSGTRPALDATGTTDMGNIDCFTAPGDLTRGRRRVGTGGRLGLAPDSSTHSGTPLRLTTPAATWAAEHGEADAKQAALARHVRSCRRSQTDVDCRATPEVDG